MVGKKPERVDESAAIDEDPSTLARQETAESAAKWGESTLKRGRRKAREAKDFALRRKTTIVPTTDANAVIEVLYENQRGSFFFGIPLFSSRSLLNFDPVGMGRRDLQTVRGRHYKCSSAGSKLELGLADMVRGHVARCR